MAGAIQVHWRPIPSCFFVFPVYKKTWQLIIVHFAPKEREFPDTGTLYSKNNRAPGHTEECGVQNEPAPAFLAAEGKGGNYAVKNHLL